MSTNSVTPNHSWGASCTSAVVMIATSTNAIAMSSATFAAFFPFTCGSLLSNLDELVRAASNTE